MTRRAVAFVTAGLLAALVIVVAAVLVVGGGDDSTATDAALDAPPSEQPAPGDLSDEQRSQLEQLQSCMAEQGVESPQPGDSETLEALEQCREYIPEGVGPGGGGAPGGGFQGP